MRILLTGGCGFIGHHFLQHVLKNTDWSVAVLDKLSYSCKGLQRVKEIGATEDPRVQIYTWDMCQPISEGLFLELRDIDRIVHMAAETHVDNSIKDPVQCIHNNVMSTVHILEFARQLPNLQQFLYFSTDEVYGPAPDETLYKEWDRHNPTNPYSASKSAAEQICMSYNNTYNVPVMICNVMNVFGERQYVEKFIPLCIRKIMAGETIQIHSYPGCQKAGSRFYIHARNVAAAVLFIMQNGTLGEKYNITGETEMDNLTLALQIGSLLNKVVHYELVDFHTERPGHDLRYGLDGTKLKEMGWVLPVAFEASLAKMVAWTLDHKSWLEY